MISTARLYGSVIAIVSGVYSLLLATSGTAMTGGAWLMAVVGVIVFVHGVVLLTPIAENLGSASGPLMIVYAVVMLLNQAWMGTSMSGSVTGGMDGGTGGGMDGGTGGGMDSGMGGGMDGGTSGGINGGMDGAWGGMDSVIIGTDMGMIAIAIIMLASGLIMTIRADGMADQSADTERM